MSKGYFWSTRRFEIDTKMDQKKPWATRIGHLIFTYNLIFREVSPRQFTGKWIKMSLSILLDQKWLFLTWFWESCKSVCFLNFKNLVEHSPFFFPGLFTRFFGIKNSPEILNQAELGENSSCLLGYIRVMFFRCSKTRSFQIIRYKSWKYQPCFDVIALYSRVLSKCSNEHTNKLTFYYQFEFYVRFVFSFGNYAFAKNNHYPRFEITSCQLGVNFTLLIILEKNGENTVRQISKVHAICTYDLYIFHAIYTYDLYVRSLHTICTYDLNIRS